MKKPEFIQESVPLTPFSTFKIGGPARYFASVKKIDALKAVYLWAKAEKIPIFILGGGSNLLIHDNGFDGLVIKMDFTDVRMDGGKLEVGAGARVMFMVHRLARDGWHGLEWACGLPGTFGGALRGNAGAYRHDIGEFIEDVTVLHNGKIEIVQQSDCEFAYRTSVFKTSRANDIIITMRIRMHKGGTAKALRELNVLLKKRAENQPRFPSAGCVFKNYLVGSDEEFDRITRIKPLPYEYRTYKKIPAAWLIEQSGLKGLRVGGAEVSDVHAAFITNTKSARAADVWELMRQVKQQVYNIFCIILEEEIQLVGFESSPAVVRHQHAC